MLEAELALASPPLSETDLDESEATQLESALTVMQKLTQDINMYTSNFTALLYPLGGPLPLANDETEDVSEATPPSATNPATARYKTRKETN